MPIPFNIGVLQLSMEPAQETVAMAKACEDAGFDTFWIAEAYPWWRKHSFEARSSTAILAVIASQTSELAWLGIIRPTLVIPVDCDGGASHAGSWRRSLPAWIGRFENLHEEIGEAGGKSVPHRHGG
jgi:hypothetical protein